MSTEDGKALLEIREKWLQLLWGCGLNQRTPELRPGGSSGAQGGRRREGQAPGSWPWPQGHPLLPSLGGLEGPPTLISHLQMPENSFLGRGAAPLVRGISAPVAHGSTYVYTHAYTCASMRAALTTCQTSYGRNAPRPPEEAATVLTPLRGEGKEVQGS